MPGEMLRKLKLAVAGSVPARRAIGHLQTRSVERLLRELDGWTGERASDALTRRLLAAKAPARQPIPERPTVVAFGYEDWERFGLWPSMARVTDLLFVSMATLAATHRIPNVGPSHREELSRAYLAEVDARLARGPVHVAFFYVDAGALTPWLFTELAKRRVWSVVMGLDDKHQFVREKDGVAIGQETILRDVDLYWTTWRAGADLVRMRGGTPWYAPEAADPTFHKPVDAPRDLDVVFVGQRYGRRAELVDYLRANGIRVDAFGRGWEGGHVTFEKTIELFSRAKVVLGVGETGQMSGLQALKGRDFEVPMCGALYCTTYNPELADWWHIGSEMLCWSSFENCLETLRWILPRVDTQAAMRGAALARARHLHTWNTRVVSLLHLLR